MVKQCAAADRRRRHPVAAGYPHAAPAGSIACDDDHDSDDK